ncbi:MAG: hypothetical protein NTW58_01045 [Actinobacteria bacterium]|nr:hypothetical protein [Actinomycetota bacterium]
MPLEGRRFPSVAGVALSGERVRFPEDLLGAPALLLCAYRRGTQADIDRWAAFAARELPGLAVFELPIIPALIWRPLQGLIDGGMRGGVPRPQWSHVVTLYDEGAKARGFIGDGGGNRAQVVLLDAAGVVVFHDSSGFGESGAGRLAAALAAPADER